MEIWKDLLLQTIKGKQFKNARTISKTDYEKKFQVFEVLVTETLAIIDPETEWHSLPVQGDDGVDFIGEIQQIKVPYIISRPPEVVLGQIKRRKGTYTKDNFHLDIIKIIECYMRQYSKDAALFEIIHVLSTDSNIDVSKWLENITYPYASYKILPVNALDFLRFWKINSNFIPMELSGIYTKQQLQPLINYIDNLQENWDDLIQVHTKTDSHARVDDVISVKITLSSVVDLSLSLVLEWIPPDENTHIVLLYPPCYEVTFVKSKFKKLFFLTLATFFYLTALEKSSSLTVPGSWPLCYSWIDYLQANGPPLSSTIYFRGSQYFMCAHREVADNSDLTVTTALF